MLKKIGFSLLILLIVVVMVRFFNNGHNQSNDNNSDIAQDEETEQTDPGDNSIDVNKVFALSEQGKVPDVPFIAGKTAKREVNEKWGEPGKTTNLENKKYVNYPERRIDFGFQNDIVFDVRSFANKLQAIHFGDIKKAKGEPDEVRYYKDDSHDQIILVYDVGSSYQLKWILPKPTDDNPNPKTDHISVVSQFTEQDEEEASNADMVEEMSLDEKIGQMIFAGTSEETLTANTKKLIHGDKVGGIIFYKENLKSPKQSVKLLNQIKKVNENSRLPLFLGIDQEGGRISRLPGDLVDIPTNEKIGQINNEQFSYKIGSVLGEQLNSFGFNLDFAPVLDVNSNPDNPIIGDRSFGNNPEVVGNLGVQTMKGIQSQHIISVVKHFPGHGDTSVDSHLQLPKVNKSLAELKSLELKPFAYAIKNGADVVMIAHILLPKIDSEYPATMSKKIITDMLRKQLNFNGVVITDDMTMKAITNNFDIGRASVKSVKAGSDIILVAHDYNKVVSVFDSLKSAVENGELTEERIDKSVSRIIDLKRKYNLTNEKVNAVDINELNQLIENALNMMP
ncbi:beta-N-acetylhexosaminidase [Virgibacillus ndiopensis]|uniref:beta-N-acetylhexosaminidase n=1 Tax=Virgibacillus ndiopensis TaxID=2004408 RepID=UPI000C06C66D|nr:beta-N-acetylhexosaminidase [Virgibacillus ndiopensis]